CSHPNSRSLDSTRRPNPHSLLRSPPRPDQRPRPETQLMRPSTTLRRMLDEPEIIVLPGAYDALSAKLAERAGFRALFTTGFGFSASALGQPDFGLLTMSETMDRLRHIVDAVSVPVVADMDTGYGNPLNTARTV